MAHLREAGLDKVLPSLTQPVLGICIGQQLMCAHSEEGDVDCLDIFPLNVKKFQSRNEYDERFKVPHIGWNKITEMQGPLFKGVDPEHAYVYYVHSFFCELNFEYTIAKTGYVNVYSAALHKDNFYAVQFHPEKSGAVGAQILENFINL